MGFNGCIGSAVEQRRSAGVHALPGAAGEYSVAVRLMCGCLARPAGGLCCQNAVGQEGCPLEGWIGEVVSTLRADTQVRPNDAVEAEAALPAIQGLSPGKLAWRRLRRNKLAMTSLASPVFIILVAAFAPLVCAPAGRHIAAELRPDRRRGQLPISGPTLAHPFGIEPGTGRDLLALLLVRRPGVAARRADRRPCSRHHRCPRRHRRGGVPRVRRPGPVLDHGPHADVPDSCSCCSR